MYTIILKCTYDKPNYRRQFDQTSVDWCDMSSSKVQRISNSYQSYNNFQKSGRATYNQGRGYHGSPSSFGDGYNQRGYQGGGRFVRGLYHFNIFLYNFGKVLLYILIIH